MNPPRYILDANVFIRAHREYYSFDFAPMFWETLAEYAARRLIGTIDKVRAELEPEGDRLWTWFKTDFASAVYSTNDPQVAAAYGEVVRWVAEQKQFFDYAKHEFAREPDAWLIAFAIAKGCTVVTLEKRESQAKRRVPIPNVCEAFGVRYIDTFQLLRELQIRWELP